MAASKLSVSYCFLYFIKQLTAHRQTLEEPESTTLVPLQLHACIKHTQSSYKNTQFINVIMYRLHS